MVHLDTISSLFTASIRFILKAISKDTSACGVYLSAALFDIQKHIMMYRSGHSLQYMYFFFDDTRLTFIILLMLSHFVTVKYNKRSDSI